MEARFICEYRPSVKKRAEIVRNLNPIRIVFLAIIGIGVFLQLLNYALMYEFQWPFGALSLFGLAYMIYVLAMPEINGFLAIRRLKKSEGQNYVEIISFGDVIEITQGKIRIIWEYSDISHVKQLKHSFLLKKDKHLGIVLDPKGFTKGTFADFKEFLRIRCPNVDILE